MKEFAIRWESLCFFVLILLFASASAKDLYDIIGVKKTATQKDIKKKFREKAKLLHPDKNQSPNAEKDFRELAEAYETLSDPEKRRSYDLGEFFKVSKCPWVINEAIILCYNFRPKWRIWPQ